MKQIIRSINQHRLGKYPSFLKNYEFCSFDPFAFDSENYSKPQSQTQSKAIQEIQFKKEISLIELLTLVSSSSKKLNQFNLNEFFELSNNLLIDVTPKIASEIKNKQLIDRFYFKFKAEVENPSAQQNIAIANIISKAMRFNLCNDADLSLQATSTIEKMEYKNLPTTDLISRIHDLVVLNNSTVVDPQMKLLSSSIIENDISLEIESISGLFKAYTVSPDSFKKWENFFTEIAEKNRKKFKKMSYSDLSNVYKFYTLNYIQSNSNSSPQNFGPKDSKLVFPLKDLHKQIIAKLNKANETQLKEIFGSHNKGSIYQEEHFLSKIIQMLSNSKMTNLLESSFKIDITILNFLGNYSNLLSITSGVYSRLLDLIIYKLRKNSISLELSEISLLCEALRKSRIHSLEIQDIIKDSISTIIKSKSKAKYFNIGVLALDLLRIGVFNSETQYYLLSSFMEEISDPQTKLNFTNKIRMLMVSQTILKNVGGEDKDIEELNSELKAKIMKDLDSMKADSIITSLCSIIDFLFKEAFKQPVSYNCQTKMFTNTSYEVVGISIPDYSYVISILTNTLPKLEFVWKKTPLDFKAKTFFAMSKSKYLFETFSEFLGKSLSNADYSELAYLSKSYNARDSKYGVVMLLKEILNKGKIKESMDGLYNLLHSYELNDDHQLDSELAEILENVSVKLGTNKYSATIDEWFEIYKKFQNFNEKTKKFENSILIEILEKMNSKNKIGIYEINCIHQIFSFFENSGNLNLFEIERKANAVLKAKNSFEIDFIEKGNSRIESLCLSLIIFCEQERIQTLNIDIDLAFKDHLVELVEPILIQLEERIQEIGSMKDFRLITILTEFISHGKIEVSSAINGILAKMIANEFLTNFEKKEELLLEFSRFNTNHEISKRIIHATIEEHYLHDESIFIQESMAYIQFFGKFGCTNKVLIKLNESLFQLLEFIKPAIFKKIIIEFSKTNIGEQRIYEKLLEKLLTDKGDFQDFIESSIIIFANYGILAYKPQLFHILEENALYLENRSFENSAKFLWSLLLLQVEDSDLLSIVFQEFQKDFLSEKYDSNFNTEFTIISQIYSYLEINNPDFYQEFKFDEFNEKMEKLEKKREIALSPETSIKWKEKLDLLGIEYIENFTIGSSLFVFSFYFPERFDIHKIRNIAVSIGKKSSQAKSYEGDNLFSNLILNQITHIKWKFVDEKLLECETIFDSVKEFYLGIGGREF